MALGHFADDRQTHSRSRVIFLAVEAFENSENPIVVPHVKADAPIRHRDDDLVERIEMGPAWGGVVSQFESGR